MSVVVVQISRCKYHNLSLLVTLRDSSNRDQERSRCHGLLKNTFVNMFSLYTSPSKNTSIENHGEPLQLFLMIYWMFSFINYKMNT